jgi:hypothetical protein
MQVIPNNMGKDLPTFVTYKSHHSQNTELAAIALSYHISLGVPTSQHGHLKIPGMFCVQSKEQA